MSVVEGWKRRSFSKLGKCIRGVSYKPEDLRPASAKENITLLRSNNIRDSRLNFRDLQFVKQSVVREDQKLQKGDIAICMSNGNRSLVGKSGQFLDRGDDTEYTVGAFCSIFRPSNDFDAGFVRHLFGSDEYQRQLDGILAGSAINNLKGSDVDRLVSYCPTSRPEQAKIAEILSTVDRAIEQTEALIAKQQRIKTGLMQDLLARGIDEHGNLRSEQTHQFKDSPLGKIPVEWEVLNLRDVANYQNGKSFPSSAYRSSGVRLVRPGNLAPNGWVVWDDKHTIYLPASFWVKTRDYQVGAGEILMNLTAQSLEDQFLGRVCMTPVGNACLLNQRIARITPHSCDSSFLYWALKGPHFRYYIDSIPQGTKVQHIYNKNLDAVHLAVPISLSEQKALAGTLWKMEKNNDITQRQLLKLCSLKSALMQDLLTGKKRVTSMLNDAED
jgi:type I restriction enzyme, S subunit